jgi:uncharacterized membrane protein YbhN (UPF0104 family)
VLNRIKAARPVAWVLASEARRTAAAILVALLLFGIAFLLLGRAAHFHALVAAVREANAWWLPICLAGELLAYTGYILAYRDVARADGGPVLAFWAVVRVVVIGFGAYFVGSAAGGLAVDYWALRQAGASRHESTRRVLGLNTLEWAALAAAAWLSAALVLLGIGQTAPLPMALTWLVIVPVCVAAAIWTTQPVRVGRLTRVRGPSRSPGLVHRALRGAWAAFADAIGGVALVRHIVAHPIRYPAALLGYPLYWLGDVLTLYAALRAFGAHVDAPALVLAYTTGYVATGIPLPAGGAGGVDASVALTLTLVGVPLAPAILGVLVYRAFSFWLPVIPALAFLPTVRQLKRDIEHVDRAAADGDSDRPRVARVSTAFREQ